MNLAITVTVVRAIFKFEGKYLLIEQSNASGKNYLLFPGGHVDVGESLLTGLKREIQEELDIDDFFIKKLVFVKETHSPVNKNFEFFFECETTKKFDQIKVAQLGLVGNEKIKKCLLMSETEIKGLPNFYPEDFFNKIGYQYLHLNTVSYKKRFGKIQVHKKL